MESDFKKYLSDVLCYIVVVHGIIGMNIQFGVMVDYILKMYSASAVLVGLYFTYCVNAEKINNKTKQIINKLKQLKK